jgi:hypothetical protein
MTKNRLDIAHNRVKNKLGKGHFLYDRIGRVLRGEYRKDEIDDSLVRLAWWELKRKNVFEVACVSFLTSVVLLVFSIVLLAILCQL